MACSYPPSPSLGHADRLDGGAGRQALWAPEATDHRSAEPLRTRCPARPGPELFHVVARVRHGKGQLRKGSLPSTAGLRVGGQLRPCSTSARAATRAAFTVIPNCSPPHLVRLWCGARFCGMTLCAYALVGASEMTLGCSNQSTDVVAGLHPALVELGPAVRLRQCCDVRKCSFCRLAQGVVIGEHLDAEEGFLGVGAQVVCADSHHAGVLVWWLFVFAKPEMYQAAAVVDQGTGVGRVGIESLLPEPLMAGELMPLVGGALLKRQGEPRAEQGSQNGYGTGDDGLHIAS